MLPDRKMERERLHVQNVKEGDGLSKWFVIAVMEQEYIMGILIKSAGNVGDSIQKVWQSGVLDARVVVLFMINLFYFCSTW